MRRVVLVALLAALALLQYRLWIADDGVREVLRLTQAVDNRRAENAGLSERNDSLAAEVADLKEGLAAVEERARSDLGMVRNNETFFLVVPEAGDEIEADQDGVPDD